MVAPGIAKLFIEHAATLALWSTREKGPQPNRQTSAAPQIAYGQKRHTILVGLHSLG
jgi:hypothetical protein